LTFFATTRGTPTFYYGTEVFMSNTGNNSHGNIRSDFPGGWPGDEVNGFTGEGLAPEALDIQQYMRVLLNWRQSARALHGGELIHFAPRDKEDVYVYVRRGEGQTVLVMLNAGAEDVTLPASRYAEVLPRAMSGTDVLRNEKARWDPALSVEVGGRSALVWSFETPGN
jgi:glycosidase